ncbi:MAG: DUF2292 domain-containing protein [Nitrospira sp.]|jgi:hypothetical protein|nr:DUF2292 domain-containing protein [Nitrospira sp.]
MEHENRSERKSDHDIAQTILAALKGIRFGSVEIVIHNSKVVQIERKEKLRIGTDSLSSAQ